MLNPFTDNSNALDCDVYTEWAPGFLSLLLCLILLIWTRLLLSMCSLNAI